MSKVHLDTQNRETDTSRQVVGTSMIGDTPSR
jgi:hypothetical protein